MERNTRMSIQGVVVSNKNDKTIVVLVETHKRHAKYGKRVKYGKKYYAHDKNNEAKVGDTVTIMGCRKLSATKRFRLVSIDIITPYINPFIFSSSFIPKMFVLKNANPTSTPMKVPIRPIYVGIDEADVACS